MRVWGVLWLVASLAGCYHGSSELPACSIRCEEGCPSGMTCVGGMCTNGASCSPAGDAGTTCGALGQACCAGAPACLGNGYCDGTICQPGCVTDVGFGRHHGCLLRHDGTVWCSGESSSGQLGGGSAGSGAVATFEQAVDDNGPITDAIAIGAGNYHTCAVRAGGTVACWGYNNNGQLGDNSTNTASKAVNVIVAGGAQLTGIVEVKAGNDFTCARDNNGGVWCWGYNNHGQLGDNTLSQRPYAAQVVSGFNPLTGATSLSVAQSHACVAESSGHVECWGRNDYGQCGNGTNNDQLSAVSPLDAAEVAAGGWFSCARLADGTAKCWGSGWQARTGTATMNDVNTPTSVLAAAATPLTGVESVVAAGVACVLSSDHRVLCWGSSPHGQNGNGAGSLYPSPVKRGTEDLRNVDRVYAHYAHVCAHDTDGNLWCWGRNTEGELGNGTFDNVGTAEPVAAICR